MEPAMTAAQRHEASWKHAADNLKPYYDTKRFNDLDYKFGVNQAVTIGGINEKQATNARMFQSATGWLSKILWLVPLAFLCFAQYKRTSRPPANRTPTNGLFYKLAAHIQGFALKLKPSHYGM
jgi:hypothetical protein